MTAVAVRSFSRRSRRRAISPGTGSPSSSGVRLGEPFGDLLLQQHHLLERMAVAHRAVLARAGENLRPVQRQRHLAHAQRAARGGAEARRRAATSSTW